jgi:hypothetical protein
MRHTGNRIGGSNPSLSANYFFRSADFARGICLQAPWTRPPWLAVFLLTHVNAVRSRQFILSDVNAEHPPEGCSDFDESPDPLKGPGLFASSKESLEVPHMELHLAVRLFIVAVALTFVLAPMIWRREG